MDEPSYSRPRQSQPIPFPQRERRVVPPSLPLPAAPVHNLPADPNSLIGRQEEIEQVKERLLSSEVRLVTLSGPGGIGKTRVGLAAARNLRPAFPDGTFFVSLAALRDHQLVMSTIAQTLGLREMGTGSPREMVQEWLREKRVLLLLDNFEPVVEAGPDLATLLAACPSLKVLATSREALHLLAEHLVEVPPLAVPEMDCPVEGLRRVEAVQLFATRAAQAKGKFFLTKGNAQAVGEICRRLEGIPLAIELAAARVRFLSPDAIRDRLARGLEVLAGGAKDAPERLRTMRSTIAWSYDLLPEGEKRLFASLAVFVGGCTVEAAERVGNAEDDLGLAVAEGLESLAGKSLLWVAQEEGETRFGMLEAIREFAADRLAAGGEDIALRRRHARFFGGLAERAVRTVLVMASSGRPDQKEWIGRLERERDNLRAVLAWALESGDTEQGLWAACGLFPFWIDRGYVAEGRRWLDQLLPGYKGQPPAAIWALIAAGRLALQQADYLRSRQLLDRALSLARELAAAGSADAQEDQRLLGQALLWTASTALYQGENDIVRALTEELLVLAHRQGNQVSVASALFIWGAAVAKQGDHARAREALEESVTLFRGRRGGFGLGSALRTLGQLEAGTGNDAAAERAFEEALTVLREEGARLGVLQTLAALGQLRVRQGDQAGARRCAREALTLSHRFGTTLATVMNLELLARLALAGGDGVRAGRLLGSLRELEEKRGLLGASDAGRREALAAGARALLGEEAFGRAVSEGRAMSLDEAVAYALEAEPREVAAAEDRDEKASPLTSRERQVAGLIAQGLTNGEIARYLVLSKRTVEHHVASIMAKLGFTSRAKVAAWVAREIDPAGGGDHSGR